jgi:hypothetical protein
VRGTVDLASLADADGIPEMDQAVVVGDRLYVTLQRLDRRNFFLPTDRSLLAIVDTRTDALIGSIPLTGTNPFAETTGLEPDPVSGEILLTEVGEFDRSTTAGSSASTRDLTASGFFVTEADLGGNVSDVVLVDDHHAYAIVLDRSGREPVVRFDPTTRQVVRRWSPPTSSWSTSSSARTGRRSTSPIARCAVPACGASRSRRRPSSNRHRSTPGCRPSTSCSWPDHEKESGHDRSGATIAVFLMGAVLLASGSATRRIDPLLKCRQAVLCAARPSSRTGGSPRSRSARRRSAPASSPPTTVCRGDADVAAALRRRGEQARGRGRPRLRRRRQALRGAPTT